jgi:hypothetical protein
MSYYRPSADRVWRFNWRRFRFERGFWIYLCGTDGLDDWEFVADPTPNLKTRNPDLTL